MTILEYIAGFMLGVAFVGCAIGIYDLATNFRFSVYINRKFGKKTK